MEDRLQIAICEDDWEEEGKLLAVLEDIDIDCQCTVFHSAEELLKVYCPKTYDLLLMDIYMGGISGVEAVTRIREIDDGVPVAFVTTSQEFALESYRLSALKYIEKPYKKKEIEDILKLAQMEKEHAPAIRVHRGGQELSIRLSQILYLEAQGRKLSIQRKDGGQLLVNEKLSEVLPQWQEVDFFSSHKSFCVNLAQVQYIDPELKCFVMTDGKKVPIRRETMGKAKRALEDFLFRRARGSLL